MAPEHIAEYVSVQVQCAQGRFNRAARALEAAKVCSHIAEQEYREAKDDLIKVTAEAKLGRHIDGGHAFVPDDLPDQGHPSYTCAVCGKRKAEHNDGGDP